MDGLDYCSMEWNGSSLTSESQDRACFRAGDPLTLALALDVCGEPMSSRSRSRSSQVYAERIGGNDVVDVGCVNDGGGGGG